MLGRCTCERRRFLWYPENGRQLCFPFWWSETEEDYTQEWRDELRGEELALVESWDRRYSSGVYQMCLDILQGNGV